MNALGIYILQLAKRGYKIEISYIAVANIINEADTVNAELGGFYDITIRKKMRKTRISVQEIKGIDIGDRLMFEITRAIARMEAKYGE